MAHTQQSSSAAGAPPNSGRSRWRWDAVRRLSRKHWLYLPRLFSRREWVRLLIVTGAATLLLGILINRTVIRITVERPTVGGVLREGAASEPRFLNPVYATSDADRDLTSLIFSGLIRYDNTGTLAMDLADSLDVSPDGRAYTLHLRPGVSWHDGEPFSADDVVFTVRLIQDPEYQSPLRPNWQGVVAEKLNDASVRFLLRQPYAPFVENLSVGILPQHLWRKIPREAAILSDLNSKPVGTGPYTFKKFTRRADGTVTSVTLGRNKHYHLEGPYLSEVRFSFYQDEAALIAAYRRNEIDSFAFSSATHTAELERLDINIYPLKLAKIFGIFLNPGVKPPLSRAKVRQALMLAIDRERIVHETAAGGGTIASSAIPSDTFGSNANIPPPPYDPAAAKNLIAADGWIDKDKNGVLERSEGSGKTKKTQELSVDLATSDAPELAAAAGLIAGMWQAVGVKTNVRILAVGDLEAAVIRPRAYEALLFGEVFGHDPDPYAFWHTSQLKDPGLNIALYSNRAVDRLLEDARRTNDATGRAAKYQQFQKIVSDEIGAIFLYRPVNYYAVRRGTRGIDLGVVTLPEERFNGINRWYQDTRRALR